MIQTLLLIALPVYLVSGVAIGYLIGKNSERRDWNRLIEAGKIPLPHKKMNRNA